MLPTRSDLRVVCHDLKMRSLSGIDDPVVLSDIRSRIEHVPSAESIAVMADEQVATWRKTLDGLLFDIDRADRRRTFDHAIKHRIDKGLPPYRKPILANWYNVSTIRTAGKLFDEIIDWALSTGDLERIETFLGQVNFDIGRLKKGGYPFSKDPEAVAAKMTELLARQKKIQDHLASLSKSS